MEKESTSGKKKPRIDPMPGLYRALSAARQNGIALTTLMAAIAHYWPEAEEFMPHSGIEDDWFSTMLRILVILFWFALGCLVQFGANKLYDRFRADKNKKK